MATPQQIPETRLQLRRTFAAPREKVYRAWTELEGLDQWMCRDVPTHRVKYSELNVTPGGRYAIDVKDSANGDSYTGCGVYREVTPPAKLVFTWAWTHKKADGSVVALHPESRVTVEFFKRGKSTEMVLTHEFLQTVKDREEHEQGWTGCFDILAKVLET